MTTNLVRKQIYIQRRQEALLKRMSQARGVSEAEIIRQAIEREIAGGPALPAADTHRAMEDFARLALARREQAVKTEPYRWNREEIYNERLNRWVRDTNEE